ncbi:hypothetical protein G647_04877 [Cladophialophora carrionii CBS 160.54]|uniref:Ketoreductase (KR) domain-containing protein n=1 Tax=Cladophialophora carrionii CBS 160.54 TaxID=1279043 RepID=V9D8T5_9EURO|nr:uncharacterized protein G647_04877 [Cladophialophora carrionii CBS 160.54]ETI23081.1 hypothetical protein G647_04877 [Cladophialophora carrionii CBS 160.54]
MSTKSSKTVLITGGNGALGSHIAFEIAKTHPEVFFILTSRRENDAQAQKITAQLHDSGVSAFEFLALNLASFASVKAFAAKVAERVRSKTIPPIAVLINSAAYSSYEVDEKTADGLDPVYQTNVLSPFLLTVLLLEDGFQVVDGAPRGKIIQITSETVSMGQVDFFDSWGPTEQMPVGSSLAVTQGLTRYGSSKLIGDLTMYTLREKMLEGKTKGVNIFSLDPGGMNHNSNLSRGKMPTALKLLANILVILGPFVRLFKKSMINHPSVPAAAVAKAAFDAATDGVDKEVYFVLDEQIGLQRIAKAMAEHKEAVFERVLKDTGVGMNRIDRLTG